MDNSCVFSAKNLSYRFNGAEKDILCDLSFDIAAKSIVSIVGPNGAGKSTLLNVLLGYYNQYGGSVKYFGRELNKISPVELSAKRAYIPQESETGLKFSAREYLKLSKINPSFINERQINEILSRFNVSYLIDKSIAEMSGGEARLVQLAFALLREPEIVLLDEPVSYLDYKNQKIFFDILKSECSLKKISVISILHDLNLAAYYSDKVMLISGGRILKYDATLEVLNYNTLGSIFFNSPSGLKTAKKGECQTKIKKAHVICGGGSGSAIISSLVEKGLEVSAGVLNIGDSDWSFCRENGVKIIEEEPYKTISRETYIQNIECINSSDLIVVCEFPIGTGNLLNLKSVIDSGALGQKLVWCATGGKNEFDFTGGHAQEYMNKIIIHAQKFISPDDIEKMTANL